MRLGKGKINDILLDFNKIVIEELIYIIAEDIEKCDPARLAEFMEIDSSDPYELAEELIKRYGIEGAAATIMEVCEDDK